MRPVAIAALTVLTSAFLFALSAFAQEVLPFPPTPSAECCRANDAGINHALASDAGGLRG